MTSAWKRAWTAATPAEVRHRFRDTGGKIPYGHGTLGMSTRPAQQRGMALFPAPAEALLQPRGVADITRDRS